VSWAVAYLLDFLLEQPQPRLRLDLQLSPGQGLEHMAELGQGDLGVLRRDRGVRAVVGRDRGQGQPSGQDDTDDQDRPFPMT
jgi:hypothetical protein